MQASKTNDYLECASCLVGFIWDKNVLDCVPCAQGCDQCNPVDKTCITCRGGFNSFIDSNNKLTCLPKIQNCKVPLNAQPQKLIRNNLMK